MTAHIMNASGNMKKAVTADKLLGRDGGPPRTDEEKRAELEGIRQRFREIEERKAQQAEG